MRDKLTVGLVIADENEFAPLGEFARRYDGRRCDLCGHALYRFSLSRSGRTLQVLAVLSGVGKVNAAAFSALLIREGAQVLLSAGLSGGLSGVARGEFALGTAFSEHDFDLSPLGLSPGSKPDQPDPLPADPLLNQCFLSRFPNLRTGPMVCGDQFVSDDLLRSRLVERYRALSCDMETAAVAAVASLFHCPFTALRMISDDAGNLAGTLYSHAVGRMEKSLLEVVFEGMLALIDCDALWNRPF